MSLDEVQAIVDAIALPDRRFRLMLKGDGFLLQVTYLEADADTPDDQAPKLQQARKWYVSPYATETEIVDTAFAAAQRSALHVVAEHFTYKGRRVYSPHFHIDARLGVCDSKAFDSRKPVR